MLGKLNDHSEKERKRYDFALKKLQRVGNTKRNTDRIKSLDFFIKTLPKKNEGRTYIKNVEEAMLKHYQVYLKRIKPLQLELKLSDF